MATIFASAAKHGTTYLDQRGRKVEKIGLNMQGQTILRRLDGSGEERVEKNYILAEDVAPDADAPAIPLDGVVGKPRPVIETVISDLTDAQLEELVELDTRMFVEVLVAQEQKRRAETMGEPDVPFPSPSLDLPEPATESLGLPVPEAVEEVVSPPVPAEVPQEPTPNAPVPPVSTPERKFARGWCPVCGHEGMRCADGRIRAHQRDGSPCEGQLALDSRPSAADLLKAEVASVPEALPGSTEPNDLGSDYHYVVTSVEGSVVQADEDAPTSDDFGWAIKAADLPPVDNDVSKHPLEGSQYTLPPTPPPPPYRGEAPLRLSANGTDRLNAVRQTLRDLDAALPGYFAAREAVDTLRDFGVRVDLDADRDPVLTGGRR